MIPRRPASLLRRILAHVGCVPSRRDKRALAALAGAARARRAARLWADDVYAR